MKTTLFSLLLVLGLSAAAITKPENLFFYSQLESLTASDVTGGSIASVPIGTPNVATGFNGNGVRFNNGTTATDFLKFGVVQVAGAVTFSAWIYLNDLTSASHSKILSNKAEYNTDNMGVEVEYTPNTNTLSLVYGAQKSMSVVTVIPAQTWTHIVIASVPGAICKFYVNGTQITTPFASVPGGNADSTVTAPKAGQALTVGASSPDGTTINPTSEFHGVIDEIRIYNVTLTDADVLSLFKEDFTVTPATSATSAAEITSDTNPTSAVNTQAVPSSNPVGSSTPTTTVNGAEKVLFCSASLLVALLFFSF